MRMRMIAAAVLACGLIGGVVALGQRPDSPPQALPSDSAQPPSPEIPPPIDANPPPIGSVTDQSQDDPMQVVEAFVERSRKEAEASIDKLTKEAESLRARLQKVEAALERWKAVEQAMREPVVSRGPQLESIPSAMPGDLPPAPLRRGAVKDMRRPSGVPVGPAPELVPAPIDAGEKK